MFNNNTFLKDYLSDLSANQDFSETIKDALTAWENGSVSWSTWVSGYVLQVRSAKLSGVDLSDQEFIIKTTKACIHNTLAFEDIQISTDDDVYTNHIQMTAKLTDRISGTTEDYHICLTYSKTMFSANYALEIVSPEMQDDVTICHCAEHRMKKFVPAFA